MDKNNQVAGRYFLVGSARSGTTLLQAMLACHSRVFSFPESHFFCRAVPRSRRLRMLGLAERPKARAALSELLGLLGRKDLVGLIPGRSPFFRSYARAFVLVIDRAALDASRDIWLEKTPHHVDYITAISGNVPRARFIHILRDGRDVLASQIHAQMEDPQYWGKWSIERLVTLWNRDVQTSLKHEGQPNHILVSYESLLECREIEIARLCAFMGIDPEPRMQRHWEAANDVIGWRRSRPWMQTVYEPLKDTRLKKFAQVFTESQQAYIKGHLLWGGQVRQVLEATPAVAAAAGGPLQRGG